MTDLDRATPAGATPAGPPAVAAGVPGAVGSGATAPGRRFVFECPLRWSDMDAYGHVNNARFLTLYEEARVALMFDGAREQGISSFEEGVVIHRHEVDYLRPVSYHDPVRIELWLEEIRPSRFVVRYELFAGGLVASRARTVCVPFDLTAGRVRRLTGAERDFLAPWLA